uniref:Uncharacterized protein n=1 Tax=Ditylenchus dipsaci TaxID=166011 RepID=A0A915CST9_9BILA
MTPLQAALPSSHQQINETTALSQMINEFNIKSRTVNSALDTPQAECNNPSPLTAKTAPVSSKDYSPAHFRHCSNPSTSTAASNHPLPSYHHKTGTGSLGKSGVLATRSQPLRPAPSLASLRGLLTGSSSSNAMGHCNPVASSSSKNKGRDASVDSIARAMCNADKLGEMRLRLWYNVEEVLPFFHYQPLYTNLIKSLNVRPYSSSLTSLLSYLRCHDVNTLFRSQTMASKIMYELMKFVGHDYLVISLKPLIDLIYAERKCCEIDPSKLKPGDSLEHNLRNITVYAELAFSRVVDSYSRCPHVLREVFLELREVVHTYFPDRDDVARLALSSFLIMRFFAAAILNPKLFALKRDTPDADVCRTLVLVSKILQRLANCVVSSVPLTTKEQWLTPVLVRFSSDAHKTAMIDFLDGVSAVSLTHDHSTAANDENVSPTVYKESPVVLLKHGQMVERRSGTDKKRSFKNLIHQKRRYVTLTETQLSWQKVKDASPGQGESPSSEVDQHKAVSPLPEVKNSFRVATPSSEVHFQANNASEMNEWLIVIQKQQRRHIMQLNRPCSELSHLLPPSSKSSISTVVDVDMEHVKTWTNSCSTFIQVVDSGVPMLRVWDCHSIRSFLPIVT